MTLNRRQRYSYRDTVDIYAIPEIPDTHVGTNIATDLVYPSLPTYKAVPCIYFPTPETDTPAPAGRGKVSNLFTLDKMHLDVAVDIADGYLVRLTTQHNPQLDGTFWLVQGNPKQVANSTRKRSNMQLVYIKHSPKPKGVL